MLIRSETIQFLNNTVYTSINDQDDFVIVAWHKVICIVKREGTVYKRLKSCAGGLGLQVDIALDSIKGKKSVEELDEKSWLALTGEV